MPEMDRLMEANRRWSEEVRAADAGYFERRSRHQAPDFLFIGCSDSRVPANMLTGSEPGQMFVHRNIANQVVPSDLNVLSVLQYGVEVLDIRHIIVCGHYGCGGVKAGAGDTHYGLVDHWLGTIRTIRRLHQRELDALPDDEARIRRLTELNVLHQVYNLTLTPVVREAWARGHRPILHGLVYSLEDGLLHGITPRIDSPEMAQELLPML